MPPKDADDGDATSTVKGNKFKGPTAFQTGANSIQNNIVILLRSSWRYRTTVAALLTAGLLGGAYFFTYGTDRENGTNPSPLGPKGTVYATDDAGYAYALDAATGSRKWEFHRAGDTLTHITPGGKRAFVSSGREGSSAHSLYSLDNSSGDTIWSRQDYRCTSFEKAVDRTVYMTGPRDFCALDAQTGRERWHYSAQEITRPAIDKGVICIGTEGALYALEAATGKALWSRPGEWMQGPLIESGRVYIPNRNTTFALDAGTGREVWRHDSLPPAGGSVPDRPTISGDAAYLTDRETLYSLDKVTGKERWRHKVRAPLTPVPDGKHIYLADRETGEASALNAASGDELWRRTITKEGILVGLSISENTLYAATDTDDNDQLHALEAATGKNKWSYSPENPGIFGFPITAKRVVYFIDDNHLNALAPENGKRRWHYITRGRITGLVYALPSSLSATD